MSYYEMISLAVQAIGYCGIVVSILLVYRQMHVNIFCEYTKRFLDIEQELSPFIRDLIENKSYDDFNADEKRQIRNVMRKYLNMCSEEFHLQRSGFIKKSTWKVWELGIKETINIPAMRSALIEIKKEYMYFEEFYNYIVECANLQNEQAG